MSALPARRALLDHPQRLGFLPTLWFWNDRERQHLMVPLIVAIALPITVLFFLVVAWMDLPIWLLLVFGTVWPQVVLGLVERHVRRELRQRALGGGGGLPSPPVLSEPLKTGDRATLALAGLGASGTLIAVAAAWGPGPALLAGLVFVLFAAGVWALPRLVQRERAAPALPGPNRPEQLPPPEGQG